MTRGRKQTRQARQPVPAGCRRGKGASVHRADPYASRPSPRRRGRHDPLPHRGSGGLASSLLQPPPDPGPAPWTPRRTRFTIRGFPPRRTGILGGYRVHFLDVVTVLLGLALALTIFWPR